MVVCAYNPNIGEVGRLSVLTGKLWIKKMRDHVSKN